MPNKVYIYTASVISLCLLCPLFMHLLFGRRFKKLGWVERNMLFLPTTIVIIMSFLELPEMLKGQPFYFMMAVFAMQLAAMFYPIKFGLLPFLRPYRLTLLHDGKTAVITRKQIVTATPRVSYMILSYARSLPVGVKDTVHMIKLENPPEKLFSSYPLNKYVYFKDGGQMYAAVYMGEVVTVRNFSV